MDLSEFDNRQVKRHPWETARLEALSAILRPHLFNGIKVLDVGCGDGFISRGLFGQLQAKEITAVDIHLSDEQILEFNKVSAGIDYTRVLPDNGTFNLALLLDVVEHVEDDVDFLAAIVTRYLAAGDKLLLTAPAFQTLYGPHDVILGHHRRYHLHELEALARSAGLTIISSGYLFASLVVPKYLLCNLLKIGRYAEGVGQWDGGRMLTGILEGLLNLDNSLLLLLARYGIKIPGLSGWALCAKQA